MRAATLAGLLIFLTSCSSATGPDRVRQLGVIAGFNNDDPRITFQPEGRRVEVTVTTYGDGCYTEGDTEVVVQGLEAEITPYDYTAPPGTACDRILRSFVHQVSVLFEAEGTARIRIRGIDGGSRRVGNLVGDTLLVERSVHLRQLGAATAPRRPDVSFEPTRE